MHQSEEAKHICFEGGPCAGKTTALAIAKQQLEERGFTPIIIPETATLIIQSGVSPAHADPIEFQRFVVAVQNSHERNWQAQAKVLFPDKKLVFLYDRGLLSGAAYLGDRTQAKVDHAHFEQNVLKPSIGESCERARSHYDALIHMVTAADGAEAFYTLANNTARSETPEQARQLDSRTMNAWLGHGHLRVVNNRLHDGSSKSFDQKIDDVMGHVYSALGIPVPIEDEDKYLLTSFHPDSIPTPYVAIDIEQTYLLSEFDERVRKRKSLMGYSYYHTIKKPGPNGARFETERCIKETEYKQLLARRNPKLLTIKKRRYCFIHEGQYFEIDVFAGERKGLILAEREKTHDNPTTKMPKFLGHYTDVSQDPKYKNRSIAEPSWTL